jgi:hypothetical protein
MLTVYVPAPGSTLEIEAGAALIGTPDPESGSVLIDYQDSGSGRDEFRRFIDRVRYAAGRHLERYPTRARRSLAESDLIAVGHYDERERVIYIDGPEAKSTLAAWLGVSELNVNEFAA